MKTKPAYLVIDTDRRAPAIVRVTQRKPYLDAGEMTVRVEISIPDEAIAGAVTYQLVIDDPAAIAIPLAADPVPVEPDEVAA